MVSTNDIRPGQSIIYENNIYLILEYQHVKPGKGRAFVKTKLKNICLSLSEKFTKFATINCDFLFTLRPFTTFQLLFFYINNIK